MATPDVDALSAAVASQLRTQQVPGLSVAVVEPGRVLWSAGFGRADLTTGAPARPTTPYLWFSLTKIATATAVMRMVDDGAVDLDAPVATYLPAFAVVTQPRPVTVRHLLSHTAGLANPLPIRWVYPASAPPPDRPSFVERLLRRHSRLRSEPGTRASYSNLGYLVLGEVIAAVSGRSYADHLRDRLLRPLGMNRTGFGYAETGDATPAAGYQRLPRGFTPLLRAALPAGVVAGRVGRYVAYHRFYVIGTAYGGLVGDVTDAAKLALSHLNNGAAAGGRVLSERSAIEMRQITPRGGPIDFGLGWFRRRSAPATPPHVEHLGGGSGYFNVMRLYPDLDLGIVLMANTTRYDHEAILADILAATTRG
jgi:CubicO group peptidase (beta-lactamase class C family)